MRCARASREAQSHRSSAPDHHRPTKTLHVSARCQHGASSLAGPVVNLSVPCTRHCSLKDNLLNDKAKQALRKAAKKRKSCESQRKSLFERMGISKKKEPASAAEPASATTTDRPGIELIL